MSYICMMKCDTAVKLNRCCRSIHAETIVVGGKNASKNGAPYIVTIQQNYKNSQVHICAGSILNEHWIITAAHCIPSESTIKKLFIEAGRYDLSKSEKTVQRRTIDYYVKHRLFLGGVAPYDIGLIYTKVPFVWNDAVKPINLPAADRIHSGKSLTFGWGDTSSDCKSNYPDILQNAVVTILAYSEAERAFGGPVGSALHPTNICTGPLGGGISGNTGDSGGPLVQRNPEGILELIGIVSWGAVPCGRADYPSVYVKVSDFINWINDEMKVVM